jgi:hypothetical protein
MFKSIHGYQMRHKINSLRLIRGVNLEEGLYEVFIPLKKEEAIQIQKQSYITTTSMRFLKKIPQKHRKPCYFGNTKITRKSMHLHYLTIAEISFSILEDFAKDAN